MFGKFDVQSVRSSVFWCLFQDYQTYTLLYDHQTELKMKDFSKSCLPLPGNDGEGNFVFDISFLLFPGFEKV